MKQRCHSVIAYSKCRATLTSAKNYLQNATPLSPLQKPSACATNSELSAIGNKDTESRKNISNAHGIPI